MIYLFICHVNYSSIITSTKHRDNNQAVGNTDLRFYILKTTVSERVSSRDHIKITSFQEEKDGCTC